MSEFQCPKCGVKLQVSTVPGASSGRAAEAPPPTLDAYTMEQLSDELDLLQWKEFRTGGGAQGWSTQLEGLPAVARAKFCAEWSKLTTSRYLHIGGYAYGRFGEGNSMISKYPRKAGLQTK